MNEQVNERLDQIDEVVQWAQDERPGAGSRGDKKEDYVAYVEELLDKKLGPVKDLTREIRELLGAGAPPPQEEGPITDPPEAPGQQYLDGLKGGFTAPNHWDGSPNAIDVYTPKGKGTLIAMPIGGTVRMKFDQEPGDVGATAIYEADNGYDYHFGHVSATQYREGRMDAGTPFAVQGSSGLAIMEQYNPSHIHFAWTRRGVPLGQDGLGEGPALKAWLNLGFSLAEITQYEPGPQDYMSGQWYAGRRR